MIASKNFWKNGPDYKLHLDNYLIQIQVLYAIQRISTNIFAETNNDKDAETSSAMGIPSERMTFCT